MKQSSGDQARRNPRDTSGRTDWSRTLGWSLVVWLCVGLLRGTLRLAFHVAPSAVLTLGYGVFYDAYWIPVTPVLWQLVRWSRSARRRSIQRYGVVALAGGAAIVGFGAWMMIGGRFFYGRHTPFFNAVLRVSDTAALDVAGILMCAFAVQAYREFEKGRAAAIRLERELEDAQLQMLTSQLHPHFLFNTLHLVSEVVHADRGAAMTILRNLEYLLAQAAAYSHRREVPLETELAFLDAYIQIQERRFRGRLVVDVDANADLGDTLVPHLLLQPLVENAIKHGVGARRGTGRVRVAAGLAPDQRRLRLEVVDDGVGFPSAPPSGGIGLRNTRLRLDRLYGSTYDLRIEPSAPTGTKILIDLPRSAAADSQNSYETPHGDAASDPQRAMTPAWLFAALHPVSAALMIVLGWIVVAAAWTTANWSLTATSRDAPAFLALFRADLANAAVWCVLTPVVVWIARRIRVTGVRTPTTSAARTRFLSTAFRFTAHAAAAALVAGLHMTAWPWLAAALGLPVVTARTAPPVTWLLWDMGAYLLIAAATHVYDYVRWTHESMMETARLGADAARARERVVRLRLQPRVLSAMLRTLSSLAAANPDLCDEAILRSGDFLRALLRSSRTLESTVETEIALSKAFLDVMHVGAKDRWSFGFSVAPALDHHYTLSPGSLLAVVAALTEDAPLLRGPFEVCVRATADGNDAVCETTAMYAGDEIELTKRVRALETLRDHWTGGDGDARAMEIDATLNGGVRVRFELSNDADAFDAPPNRVLEGVA